MGKKKKITQKLLRFGANEDGRGGVRENAGRPRSKKGGVPHRTRPEHKARYPVHIVLKLKGGLPALRKRRARKVIESALAAGRVKFGFRLNQYSVQNNHLHLIVEADDRAALSRGLKGLAGRIAKALNKLWQRKGPIFPERYHETVLTTPRQVRYVIAYVLENAMKHGHRMPTRDTVDPFSSGAWFDGWRDEFKTLLEAGDVPLVTPARTWLQTRGWRKCGLVPVAVLG